MPEQDIPSVEEMAGLPTRSRLMFFGLVKSFIFSLPIVLILVIVTLALIGPAVGNVFSNVVNSL